MLFVDDELRCAQCGHRWVNHGDRAITACDGAIARHDTLTRHATDGGRALCQCTGWTPPGSLH